jgi:hypothetical protein
MAAGARSDHDDRRAGVRRTVAVLGVIAVFLYGLFFIRAALLS